MNTAEVKDTYAKYMIGNYARNPIAIVRGQGSYIYDAEGKRYLDLLPGLGVDGLGHCPPRVVGAIKKQADALLHIHNNYMWEQQCLLGKALVERLPQMAQPKAFFCNSGTEASEAAIKMARLYGKQKGGKWKIISVQNGFHGRTYGALTATGQPGLQKGCEPLLPGFTYVPLNDVAALEKAFDSETVGFMVEPVQGEGGIFIADSAYLKAAREICNKHGALLMYDEVQCGMGRTGDYFAFQTLQAPAPDIIWLAKALGGGFPIGAMLAASDVAQYLVPGTHGTTFGGNPLACAAGLAVIETIEQDKLIPHVRAMSKHLSGLLSTLKGKYPAKIKDIRQLGLMVGIDLNFSGKPVFARCLELGLLINVTHETTLRLLPAMNVTSAELDEGLEIITSVLAEF
ncbi:MAG TPA: aspartate aminotransferase family protein [Planctomycetota bacterium]|nr:aspartate aminotransferase family protein [Planctomycetota bacterium]